MTKPKETLRPRIPHDQCLVDNYKRYISSLEKFRKDYSDENAAAVIKAAEDLCLNESFVEGAKKLIQQIQQKPIPQSNSIH